MAAMLKRRSLQRRWPDKEARQRLNHPYIMTTGLGFAFGAMVCFGASDLIYKRAAAAGIEAGEFLMQQAWIARRPRPELTPARLQFAGLTRYDGRKKNREDKACRIQKRSISSS
jgi:hypothetical protein